MNLSDINPESINSAKALGSYKRMSDGNFSFYPEKIVLSISEQGIDGEMYSRNVTVAGSVDDDIEWLKENDVDVFNDLI